MCTSVNLHGTCMADPLLFETVWEYNCAFIVLSAPEITGSGNLYCATICFEHPGVSTSTVDNYSI